MKVGRDKAALFIWLAAAATILPSAYVASVGPVAWLQAHGYLSASVSIIYMPLSWLCDHCEPLYDLIEMYTSLWQ